MDPAFDISSSKQEDRALDGVEVGSPIIARNPTGNISDDDKLKQLIHDSRKLTELMKKLGNKAHERLANIYGNPTHFITELLQNAEDEEAENVVFKLSEDSLEFSHDAKKLFDFNDIKSISNFGDNEVKKQKPNAIGRFGIGFKSVYSITELPRIISAGFDITIVDYNVPEQNDAHTFYKGTKFIFPFKQEKKKQIFELLSEELSDLNLEYLLFLSKIRSIQFNSTIYERLPEKKDKRFITLKSDNKERKYFLLEKLVEIDKKKLSIKIAFLLNKDRKITACAKSLLFVFFPTKIETNLKFLVHAPFYTTPSRENIEEGDSLINIEEDQRNEILKNELGKLLAGSLDDLKKLKMLDIEVLNVFPINKNNCSRSDIYLELYNSVKRELLSTKPYIPNVNGGFSTANDSMLLGSSELAELLDKKQNLQVFGRNVWVNRGVTTSDKIKDLRDYMRSELAIPEYDLTLLASKIDEAFLTTQPDSWIIQFYRVFHKTTALWKIGQKNPVLRTKPIIRVEIDGKIKQIIPFKNNGKPNVFLPVREHSHYQTVKPNIAKNRDARKFLEELGLTEPDLFAEVNEFIIPRILKTKEIAKEYFDDFTKIMEAMHLPNLEKHSRLLNDLRSCSFILGVNLETGETKLLRYYEMYFPTDGLKKYFQGNTTVFFLAEDQYRANNFDLDRIIPLLREIGIKDYPRRNEFEIVIPWDEKRKLRGGGDATRDYHTKDYFLDGLTHFFARPITSENSLTLWTILIKCMSTQGAYWQHTFFQGEYKYKYYSDYTARFDSTFLKQLKNTSWIFKENDTTVVPSEISYSELPARYKVQNEDSLKLSTILGLKPDEIREIEQKTGGKFIPREELENYEQWKLEQKKNTPKPDEKSIPKPVKGFEPDCEPENATLSAKELKGNDVSKPFKTAQLNNSGFDEQNGEDKTEDNNNQQTEGTSNDDINDDSSTEQHNQKLLNEIGDWGQKYVAKLIAEEFKDDPTIIITDLNQPGSTGVGCDFAVTKGDEIVRLVEVKATVERLGQTLSISGTQWEVARRFFKENNGDKYWVYCVFSAGQQKPDCRIIKNPHQKWIEGTLYAHPVYFEINGVENAD